MSNTPQTTTKTLTRVLTDEVRSSPVDRYLEPRNAIALAVLAIVVVLLFI